MGAGRVTRQSDAGNNGNWQFHVFAHVIACRARGLSLGQVAGDAVGAGLVLLVRICVGPFEEGCNCIIGVGGGWGTQNI
jgi:hypothetical protein